jgi:hypothetical protein
MDGGLVSLVMAGLFAGLIIVILLLGWLYPGSGAEQLDWRPSRSPDVEAENEVDDITQMLEAANERRRRRGAEELTEEGLSARVRAEQQELAERALEEHRRRRRSPEQP